MDWALKTLVPALHREADPSHLRQLARGALLRGRGLCQAASRHNGDPAHKLRSHLPQGGEQKQRTTCRLKEVSEWDTSRAGIEELRGVRLDEDDEYLGYFPKLTRLEILLERPYRLCGAKQVCSCCCKLDV